MRKERYFTHKLSGAVLIVSDRAMAENMNLEIGERIRIARKSRGFSRDKFSEMIGISTLFLGYIECGQRGMSLVTLQKICKTLNVSADYLLFGREERSSFDEIKNAVADIDEKYYDLALEYINILKRTIALIENDES